MLEEVPMCLVAVVTSITKMRAGHHSGPDAVLGSPGDSYCEAVMVKH